MQALRSLVPVASSPLGSAVVLGARRIYVLPTRQGWFFIGMLVVMLIGAINYGNSLAYVLTFLLAGVLMVSPLHTQGNLMGLRFDLGRCDPVFAGGHAVLRFTVSAAPARPRAGLRLVMWPKGGPTKGEEPVATDIGLAAGTAATVQLPWPAPRRGWLELPPVLIETRYPFGLFVCWSRVDLKARCLVYPKADGRLPLPVEGAVGDGADLGANTAGIDDFQGLRAYRVGDPVRRLAWRSWRPGAAPQVMQFTSGGAERMLDFQSTVGLLNTEARLNQLAAWVLAADAAGEPCGLRLPGMLIAPATGRAHRDQLLSALALYGLES